MKAAAYTIALLVGLYLSHIAWLWMFDQRSAEKVIRYVFCGYGYSQLVVYPRRNGRRMCKLYSRGGVLRYEARTLSMATWLAPCVCRRAGVV